MAVHLWAVAEAAAEKRHISAHSDTVGYAAGIMTWVIAGSVFAITKIGVTEMPPWMFCFARALLAALILLPFVTAHYHAMIDLLRKRWLEAAFIGAIGLGLTQGTLFTALSYTSAVNVGIVFATVPMLTMVAAHFILDDRMNAWQALGSLVAFAGIIVIAVHGSMDRLLGLKIEFGDLITLGAVVMFTGYSILLKRAKFELATLPLIVILLAAGSLATLPFALFEVWKGEHANLGMKGYLALAYTVTVGGAILYICYNWSIEVLGAARAGLLIYTQMIFATFFGWLILGEKVEWYHYAGGGLIIIGIFLVTLLRPKQAHSPAN